MWAAGAAGLRPPSEGPCPKTGHLGFLAAIVCLRWMQSTDQTAAAGQNSPPTASCRRGAPGVSRPCPGWGPVSPEEADRPTERLTDGHTGLSEVPLRVLTSQSAS